MWKRLAVLIVVALLPVTAVAHTKLFYRMSYRSEYRKVEVMIATPESMVTAEPTEIPLVEIPLESTMTPEPTPTPILTEIPTVVQTSAPEALEQTTTPTDLSTTPQDIV